MFCKAALKKEHALPCEIQDFDAKKKKIVKKSEQSKNQIINNK
jgi:hypothetical protein